MSSLSNQLQARRKGFGLSQQEIARRAGVDQPLVSGFERGRDVRVSTIEKLVTALDMELVPVPREHLAEVWRVIEREAAPPTPPAEKSLLERFQVPDKEEKQS